MHEEDGGGLVEDGGGLEEDWRRIGGGWRRMEEDGGEFFERKRDEGG